jgi:hypothetical protein
MNRNPFHEQLEVMTLHLRKIFIALLVFGGLQLCVPCHAQVRDISSEIYKLDNRLLGTNNTNLQILGVGTMLTLAAFATEDQEQTYASLENASLIDVPMDVGNMYGAVWVMSGLTVGIGAFGYMTHNERFTQAGWDLGKSLLVTTAVVGAIKFAVDRPRPDDSRYSFPSGHTATAFAAAPVLHHHFGWQVGMTAYGLAAFTALGRMEENRHFLSDVVAGATIGMLTSRLLLRDRQNLSVFATPQRVGISYDF